MDTKVARRPIVDMDAYKQQLRTRRDPIAGVLQGVYQRLRRQPRRVVFAEGEEEQVIRAAATFVQQGLGTALLVGREDRVKESAAALGVELGHDIEIINARLSSRNAAYSAYLYERLQRHGFLQRDCQRLVNQDRNHFASCMVALGDADAMVTGVTRNFSVALEDVQRCIDPKPGHRVIGVSMVLARGRTVLVADTAVTEMPDAEDIAEIAIEAARVARSLGYEPRLALLAFPWEDDKVREDCINRFNIRLSEPYLLKLKYIAEHTPDSMQKFCLTVLHEAINEKIEELTK